jgi:DNA-binding response OmpR family regulator
MDFLNSAWDYFFYKTLIYIYIYIYNFKKKINPHTSQIVNTVSISQ